jgi:hypothetical protein
MEARTLSKEPTMWFVSATEQVSTRVCGRCNGLLVKDWCYDLDNGGVHRIAVLRCVQCGNRIDPVILQNHTRPPDEDGQVRRVQQPRSVSMEVVGQAA